jgi:hypothetical protein
MLLREVIEKVNEELQENLNKEADLIKNIGEHELKNIFQGYLNSNLYIRVYKGTTVEWSDIAFHIKKKKTSIKGRYSINTCDRMVFSKIVLDEAFEEYLDKDITTIEQEYKERKNKEKEEDKSRENKELDEFFDKLSKAGLTIDELEELFDMKKKVRRYSEYENMSKKFRK